MWNIMVREDGVWVPCKEGPWKTKREAVAFASFEVFMPGDIFRMRPPRKTRSLIDLTRKKFRTDWSAYMVAADQHEEAGLITPEVAQLWRRRGELMRSLVEGILIIRKWPERRKGGGAAADVIWRASFGPRQITLYVIFGNLDRVVATRLHLSRVLIFDERRDNYLPERIRKELFHARYGF